MLLDTESAMQALALVVSAVREDPRLQTWVKEVAALPVDLRRQAIARVTQEMRAQRASAGMVAAFELLAHPTLFTGALQTLRECGVQT